MDTPTHDIGHPLFTAFPNPRRARLVADSAAPRTDTLLQHNFSVEQSGDFGPSSGTVLPERQGSGAPGLNATPAGGEAGSNDATEQPNENAPVVPDTDNGANPDFRYEDPGDTPSDPVVENTTADGAKEQPPSPPSPITAQPDDAQSPHENVTDDQGATTPSAAPNLHTNEPGGSDTPGVQVPKSEPERYNSQKLPGIGSTAQTAQLTGWPAVEKALTEFDRQEIAAYKEDLDSLLTFTGLYSAVLTAFVIVSYPQLQEDTAGETLQVLRLIAAQTATYTILDGRFASSTVVVPTATTPFQPSTSAIRVNVLWFASLVISLAVASLSIVVKQWLRAYMAFASASPQGQLRIRHFRRSGMETWKVFEIASMLPLLLQISLALFFIGLCIFTFSVHPAIGNTTLPLVCAWAFLLIVVTISPIFSSRCPYKTPALSAAISALRNRVYPVILMAFLKHAPYGITRALSLMFTRFTKISEQFQAEASVDPPTQEVDKLKDGEWDLHILASADALQADDNLLGTTMAEALEQSGPSWVSVTEFLVRVIGNRVPLPGSNDPRKQPPPTSMIQFHSLSNPVRSAITRIFRFHVIPGLFKEQALNPDWSGDPASLTMKRWSASIFAELNRNGIQFLVGILEDGHWDLATLASAYTLLADDEFLVTTVTELLKRIDEELNWTSVTTFIVGLIGNRVPLPGSNDPERNAPIAIEQQYHSLPDAIKATIAAIFRCYAIPGMFKQQTSNPDWHQDTVLRTMSGWFASIFDTIYGQWEYFFALIADVMKNGQLNLEVLAEIDALLADDNFLATTVVDLLHRSDRELGWVPVTEFLVRVIGHRVSVAGSDHPWQRIPPSSIQGYSSLSEAARSTVASIFKLHVVPELFKPKPYWSRDTTALQVVAGWSACIFSHAYDPSERVTILVDILKGKQWDVTILAEADTLLLDDSLLEATVTEVLNQCDRKLDWASTTESLVRMIGKRIYWAGSDDPPSNMALPVQQYDLLSEPVRTSLARIFGFHVIPGLLEQQISNPNWSDDPALHTIFEWSACIFEEMHDFGTQVHFFTPAHLFSRWLTELAQAPWLARNCLQVCSPMPPELQPSIDLVKILMWCEAGGRANLEIISTILSIVEHQEGRLKSWNSHLAGKVAPILLPMLDAVSIPSCDAFDDSNHYTRGTLLTIRLRSHVDLRDLMNYAGSIFIRRCLRHLVVSAQTVDRILTQLRTEQWVPASSYSSSLMHALQYEHQLGLARMKEIFLVSLSLDPSSIRGLSHLISRICHNNHSRMFLATSMITVLGTTHDLYTSTIGVLNLCLLAIGLADFEAARTHPESSFPVISQWKFVFNLLAYVLFRVPSVDPDTESEVLNRICHELPPCTNVIGHRRPGCSGDELFIPDYLCLALSSVANRRPLVVPVRHCRLVFLSNLDTGEQQAIQSNGEQETRNGIQEFLAAMQSTRVYTTAPTDTTSHV